MYTVSAIMWMPVSDVSEERSQCVATCWKKGVRRRAEGGHCEVAVDSAQRTPTANQDPASTFSPTRSKCRRRSSMRLVGPCKEAPPPSEDELFWHKVISVNASSEGATVPTPGAFRNYKRNFNYSICLELQRYISPLDSILQCLRSGQLSRRLSSFQQGVAVERIQRIMAMLQNPNKGGSFLTNIQKLEGMLKSWFPHVNPTLNQMDDNVVAKKQKRYSTSSSTPSSPQEVTQVNAVSSSTDCLRKRGRPMDRPFRPGTQGLPPFSITSPCLERLLQVKGSIITPPVRGGWNSQDVRAVTEDR